jgi:predicted RNA-binding Zn ribbon-like protein
MLAAAQIPKEWVDGFLIVGNHLALDFLNTKVVLEGEPRELLPDTDALERWLAASGVLSSHKGKTLVRRWRDTPQAEVFLQKLIAFRERLRTAVIRQEAGLPVSEAFVSEVNRLLEEHPSRVALQRKAAKLEREVVFEPREPEDAWEPIAAAAAELLSDIQRSRIRKCESCIVHFYDVSKKGSRRWCSMNICGNRLKVAAYQRRNRAANPLP